jgi:hypothetical protein
LAPWLTRHSSLAYIEQLQKKRGRIKTHLLASTQNGVSKKLESSEPVLSKKNRHELLFQKRLVELKEFIDENGHGSIPTPYEPNLPLGVWAANLRRQYVIREQAEQQEVPYKGYLSTERLRELKLSGFDFTSLTERQFKMRLEELKKFKERYGHTLVPEKYEKNMALGAWVSNMRTLYRKRRTKEKSALKKEKKGDNGIIKEKNSKNILQHTIAPSKRRRIRSQRLSHLDDERERLLEEVGFVWNALDRKWFEMLEWAKVYAVVNYQLSSGRDVDICLDADMNGDPENLGSFNTTGLDERDTLLLENYYTFVRNIQDQTLLPYFHPQDEILDLLLDENYTENVLEQQSRTVRSKAKPRRKSEANPLLDYRVPTNNSLHYSLRIWMVNQRSNYHRRILNNSDQPTGIPSTMTDLRQKTLEEINFPWSGRFRNRWEEVQFENEQEEKNKLAMEKETKRQKKIRDEEEKVKQLKVREGPTSPSAPDTKGAEDDIMLLWGAEDDDDW